MRRTGRTIIAILFLAVVLPSGPAFSLTTILNVRNWTAPDHTRVVIDTSEEPRYRVEKGDKKISIGLQDTVMEGKIPSVLRLNKPGISSVTLQPLSDDAVRIDFLLTEGAETKVFYLEKVQDKPYRLVVDIWMPDIGKKQSAEREQVKTRMRERIVVIDPGHGGEDPGAIGKNGTREKDVVLSVGMKLRDMLNKKKGYHAFLTRDGDYYVSFKKRLTMAREYGADLFISVHADAARNRAARGSSVYCLSLGGASSEAAKILARSENLADIVGGSEAGSENDESDPIILNMFQTNTINRSKMFGRCLLGNLQEVSTPKSKRIQEAPFRVLKLPEIPALLLESAYISNPREEKLLQSRTFQVRLAKAMADSITEFLPLVPEAPPVSVTRKPVLQPDEKTAGTNVQPKEETVSADDQPEGKAANAEIQPVKSTAKTDQQPKRRAVNVTVQPEEKRVSRPAVYRVQKGDTLSGIAARYALPLDRLIGLNRLKREEPLYVGKAIRLEDSKISVAGRAKPDGNKKQRLRAGLGKTAGTASAAHAGSKTTIYQVKKGDTLAKVASQHKTTIGVLLRLNHMGLHDTLIVDRKIILPQNASL